MTYEADGAGVCEGLRREPFPHERARRAVVDGGDQPVDVVVHWSMVMVATITASVRQHRKDAPVAKADDARCED